MNGVPPSQIIDWIKSLWVSSINPNPKNALILQFFATTLKTLVRLIATWKYQPNISSWFVWPWR
jgi:hypothetical protein